MGKDKAQKVEGTIRNSSADSASDPWHQELAGAWRDSAAAGPQSPSPSQSPSLTIIYKKKLNICLLSVLRSSWSRNYLRPVAGADIKVSINIFSSQF